MPSTTRQKRALLVAAMLAGCSGKSSPLPPGADTLTLAALSADEIAATVTTDSDTTLVCDALSVDVAAGSSVAYLAGLTPGATTHCTCGSAESDVTTPDVVPSALALFDDAHGEQAGNADWVIDDDEPPDPTTPEGRDSWTGAYSSFGFDLWKKGYLVRTNKGLLDDTTLATVQVLVLPEPNQRMTDDELTAITSFVTAGGGLVLITDHHDSDRDSDGIDSTGVADQILAALGTPTREASADLDTDRELNTTAPYGDPHDPVLHGRNGDVSRFDFFGGSAFTIAGLPTDRAVLTLNASPQNPNAGARVAASYVGAGRVLSIGDSSPADDGTGAPGDELYSSYDENDNAALLLNGVDWAAGVRDRND